MSCASSVVEAMMGIEDVVTKTLVGETFHRAKAHPPLGSAGNDAVTLSKPRRQMPMSAPRFDPVTQGLEPATVKATPTAPAAPAEYGDPMYVGKELGYYNAVVTGRVNTRRERNKSLLTLSGGEVALLTSLATAVSVASVGQIVAIAAGFAGPVVSAGAAVAAFAFSATYLESEVTRAPHVPPRRTTRSGERRDEGGRAGRECVVGYFRGGRMWRCGRVTRRTRRRRAGREAGRP